ncbi:MAG TPA: class I SAM-dependent methyltransferase [Jatrophihabitans sp.]|nr:class I SAM-dependent methyltransferase [Jatrophihabitans sp.]
MDANDWDKRYSGSELVWSATANQFVISELSGLAPGTALDLACGEGRNAIWLANQGWTVTGADFSAAALAKARELGGRLAEPTAAPISWVQADATGEAQALGRDGGYDLVLLAYLQLPATERAAAFRLAVRLLAPGGHLLVVAHDSTNLTEGVGGPQDPSVLYTAADVLAEVAATPSQVLRAERVARPVSVDGEQRTAWDALVHLVF